MLEEVGVIVKDPLPKVVAPEPEKFPIDWVVPFTLNVPLTIRSPPVGIVLFAFVCKVPALIVVPPVYVLAPLKIRVEDPAFVKDPPTPEIIPEYVLEAVRVVVNDPLPKVVAPEPETFPIDCVVLFTSKVPATATAPPEGMVPFTPAVKVPALMVVPPL